jgi:hypothetical protein
LRGARVVGEPRLLGKDASHLSFHVRQGEGVARRALAFGRGDLHAALLASPGAPEFVYQPRLERWQGETSVELRIEDLRLPGATPDTARQLDAL